MSWKQGNSLVTYMVSESWEKGKELSWLRKKTGGILKNVKRAHKLNLFLFYFYVFASVF